MSILTLFVVIPVLMLLGLWLSRSLNQVRGVMVVALRACWHCRFGSPSLSFKCAMRATPMPCCFNTLWIGLNPFT